MAFHDVLPNDFDPSIEVSRFWSELECNPNFETKVIVADRNQGMYGIGLTYL